MARSTARRRALNTLYEADEKGQDILSLLAERIVHPGAQTALPDYAVEIVQGVAGQLEALDHLLDAHSTGWRVKRMAVVDRNILRIAAWEMLHNDDVPDKVAIDEALQLAKTLSDDESPAFIHGLLSSVSASERQRAAEAVASDSQPVEPAAQSEASHVEDDESSAAPDIENVAAAAADNVTKTTVADGDSQNEAS